MERNHHVGSRRAYFVGPGGAKMTTQVEETVSFNLELTRKIEQQVSITQQQVSATQVTSFVGNTAAIITSMTINLGVA